MWIDFWMCKFVMAIIARTTDYINLFVIHLHFPKFGTFLC